MRYCNSIVTSLVICIAPWLSFAGEQTEQVKKGEEEYVNEFGEIKGDPIETGFLFFDGKYIDKPYRVSTRGISIFINDCKVYYPVAWPAKGDDNKMPELPRKITAESTFEDLETTSDTLDRHDRLMIRYFMRHYEVEDAYKRIIDYYKSLPFVEAAQKQSEKSGIIVISTKKGETVNMFVGFQRPLPVTKESVTRALKDVRERFENRLKLGACFFLFSDSGSEISFGSDKVSRDLPDIVNVLQSDKTAEEKREALIPLGIELSENDPMNVIINKFRMSDQMKERINLILSGGMTEDDGTFFPQSPKGDGSGFTDEEKREIERILKGDSKEQK